MCGDRDALDTVEAIESSDVEQVVPAMVVQERYTGVGASELPDTERRKIDIVLGTRPVIPTTEEIAHTAGKLGEPLRLEVVRSTWAMRPLLRRGSSGMNRC